MNLTVASVVWPWREKAARQAAPRKTGPSASAVLVQVAIMAVIGAGLFWGLERRAMGAVVWGLGALVLVSGFFVPSVFAALERFGKKLGKGVGVLLTWGLLAPFYYLCFVPLRLLQKIGGKDPLQLRFPTDEPTYWVSRKPVPKVDQYRKQF